MAAKLGQPKGTDKDRYFFDCPGCGSMHYFNFRGDPKEKPIWSWNGDLEKPTVSPSIRVQSDIICHFFIKNGTIQFCGDSQHEMAGKTVEMNNF